MSGANCWLASYPKSGNTWVRALIDALNSGGDPSLNRLGESTQSGEAILVMSPSAFEVDEILPLHRRTWLELAPERGYRLAKTHAAWLPGPDGYPTRWQPEVVRAWIDQYPYQFKFVVARPEDVEELEHMLAALQREIPRHKVLLMPEATSLEKMRGRATWLGELCKARGYRYAHRLHIELYGNRRGT